MEKLKDKTDAKELQDREATRIQANREELVERISGTVSEDGVYEVLPGLFFNRSSKHTRPNHSLAKPAFCVIAQGSKEVLLGEDLYRYDPANYLISTAELPTITKVTEASKEKPYLSLRLLLDLNLVNSVLVEAGLPLPRNNVEVKALDVSPLDASLLDAVIRLVRLVDNPKEARILLPLVTREIIYRLLMGEQSDRLRQLGVLGGHFQRIVTVIDRLRKDYDKPIRIDDMAQDIGMSVSGFHHHFKAVTAMSPMQFQKQLRLQEARRLIFTEKLDAASAGFKVGYDSASHFSREYKSLFGNPPLRDAEQLREAVGQIN
jgi:AraC-like DNA-binding protein